MFSLHHCLKNENTYGAWVSLQQHSPLARSGVLHIEGNSSVVYTCFSAYAMMAGTSNKGYCACPVCGPHTPSRYSSHLSKVVYRGKHRRWLPEDHPFRHDVNVSGTKKLEREPNRMDSQSHIRWAFLKAEYACFGGGFGEDEDPMLSSGVKRLPALYALPYWKVKPAYFIVGGGCCCCC